MPARKLHEVSQNPTAGRALVGSAPWPFNSSPEAKRIAQPDLGLAVLVRQITIAAAGMRSDHGLLLRLGQEKNQAAGWSRLVLCVGPPLSVVKFDRLTRINLIAVTPSLAIACLLFGVIQHLIATVTKFLAQLVQTSPYFLPHRPLIRQKLLAVFL